MKRKSLSLGIQDFEEFKVKNLVYVDKTRLIYNLVNVPKGLYFLSRPRRFGKTLLLSTLACLFEGEMRNTGIQNCRTNHYTFR